MRQKLERQANINELMRRDKALIAKYFRARAQAMMDEKYERQQADLLDDELDEPMED